MLVLLIFTPIPVTREGSGEEGGRMKTTRVGWTSSLREEVDGDFR